MPLFSSRRSILSLGINPSIPEAEGINPDGIGHVVGLAHLWAAQFQQIMNLALAGAGGLLILVQTEIVTTSGRWWVALGSFIAAAMVSMIGQGYVVDEATKGFLPGKTARRMVGLAFVFFGGSLYLLVRIFLGAVD